MGLNGVMLYRFVSMDRYNGFLVQLNEHQESLLASYKSGLQVSAVNGGQQLDSIWAKDSKGRMIPLVDIFDPGQEHILVFRYSESHCESCITASLSVLKEWQSKLGNSNLVLLGDFSNNKIYRKELDMYQLESVRAYNVPRFNLPAENLGFPYFMVLDQEGRTSNVFLPEKGTPDITRHYLEGMARKFGDVLAQ
ncbi:hypothetical protein GCM10011339_37370 [Echinicola rosea]|uniref:Thioredoxin domain-containing protein n=2 Tax=Echinicola rosea TaxID=1807691 RepID=A0ABQ1VAI2_9BACT|nr:hypothetical protein GCM10011339_37370 [Echinicola rosea]